MTNLYTAALHVAHLLDHIDPETGELPEELGNMQDVFNKQAKSVAAYILEKEAHMDMLDAHIKTLLDKFYAMRKSVTHMKRGLEQAMLQSGVSKIDADDHTYSVKLEIGRDKSVEIVDPLLLDDGFKRMKPAAYEPDKKLIRLALDAGQIVPGAELVIKNRLTIK